MTSAAPLGNKRIVLGTSLAGRSVYIHLYAVDPEFFSTMKIPLLRGRSLTRGDARSIVISKSFALEWPGGNPLGRPFQIGDTNYTVAGIARSARLVALEDPEAVEAYYLASDRELPSMIVLLRTAGTPDTLLSSVASVAKSIEPQILPEVQLMKTAFHKKMESAEYAALSVSVLGVVALLLACFGIVGLVSIPFRSAPRKSASAWRSAHVLCMS